VQIKRLSSEAASFVPFDRFFDFLFQNIPIITAEKRTVKPEMHVKITRFGWRLKLSNSKSSCKVAVLHLLLIYRPPIASCRSGDERRCTFQLFIPLLTPVSLLETKRLFRFTTLRGDG
jgi:hypothetical protein